MGSILFSIAIYTFFSKVGYDPDIALFFFIYYLAELVPTLFVHIEYYLINKNDLFTLNSIQRTFSFDDRDAISFDQIEIIVLVLSPVMYRDSNLRFFPFDSYHYAVIIMKDGKRFVITNLMTFRIDLALKDVSGVQIERRRRFIASPSLYRFWSAVWN